MNCDPAQSGSTVSGTTNLPIDPEHPQNTSLKYKSVEQWHIAIQIKYMNFYVLLHHVSGLGYAKFKLIVKT